MTEEEKKVIKYFKKSFTSKTPPYWYDDTIENSEIKIKILVNLIEKQAEEIKNWKDTCHSLADEEQLKNQIKLFAPSIKALNKLEDGKKEAQFMSKLIKYYKVILKEKKQIYEELKRRNK